MELLESCKKLAGEKAVSFIEKGMIVGLGTGSTVAYFIDALIEQFRKGLQIQVVPSSQRSLEQARVGGLPLIDINALHTIDITVDGADEVDPNKKMIKGAGGAFLMEKIVASMSREMIVIIDESKLVLKLGQAPLPVEIIPFGYTATVHKLELLGYRGVIRKNKDGSFYITENHNLIYLIHFNPDHLHDPYFDHQQIISIPGVVETGFFFDLAGRIIIGFKDGGVVVQ